MGTIWTGSCGDWNRRVFKRKLEFVMAALIVYSGKIYIRIHRQYQQIYTNLQRFGGSNILKIFLRNTIIFIQKGCKSHSKNIYNVKNIYILNKYCSLKKIISRITVFTTINYNNRKCFFHSILELFLKNHMTLKTGCWKFSFALQEIAL